MDIPIINLAQKIQSYFPKFYLAGGTAIMIKYNHRISYDLDFFSFRAFSYTRLSKKMINLFIGHINRWERMEDNIDFFINDIKVSFVFFPFENIEKTEKINNITIASDIDLFLNKIYVAGRRIDPKDPFDAAFLYSKNQWDKVYIEECFGKKFHGQSYKIYLGAICSFDDYGDLPDWVKDVLLSLTSPA
ncbi:MAG TPA: nucleotidyl transferase AbiEii/AbiGii toxin family protein [Spirochaetota bacterium]|nr:nucleotidyl transferase AbiEii/AbiGii toxin family protein [Spirochaetota bacterium]